MSAWGTREELIASNALPARIQTIPRPQHAPTATTQESTLLLRPMMFPRATRTIAREVGLLIVWTALLGISRRNLLTRWGRWGVWRGATVRPRMEYPRKGHRRPIRCANRARTRTLGTTRMTIVCAGPPFHVKWGKAWWGTARVLRARATRAGWVTTATTCRRHRARTIGEPLVRW